MATILYIEDEIDIRQTIVEELREAGFDTLEAANGREGLEAICNHKPNLVLCDVSMPKMGGHQLLQELRGTHPEHAEIPFVFLTAYGEKSQVIGGKEMGADDYLVKPVDHDELIATVRSRLTQVSRMGTFKDQEIHGMREEILQLLPHELRTPLNHIIGFSEMISEEMLGVIDNKQYVEYAENIHNSGLRLLDMIDNVLTLASALSGQLTPQLELCDIGDVVTLSVDDVRPRAQQKSCSIAPHFSVGSIKVVTDRKLLHQALIAVLDNAIKFSPDEGDVGVDLKADDNGLTISVRDNGIGMTSEQVKTALSPLSQVDKGITRTFDGLGNGLALAKCIVEAMGGEISIKSDAGEGSVVSLLFPQLKPIHE